MRSRSLLSHYTLKPYRVCPDCHTKYTSDRKTKRRSIVIVILALVTLGLSIAVSVRGSEWLLPDVVSIVILWAYLGYTLSKVTYVLYHE